jgi:ribonuclease P protein component
MADQFTFTRAERLRSKKMLADLFRKGGPARSYVAYPLRVVWMPMPADAQLPADNNATVPKVQVAISVPKRVFKTAVSRNRIKRLVREAYRLHKHELYAKLADEHHPPIALVIMYLDKAELPFADMVAGIKKVVKKFNYTD